MEVNICVPAGTDMRIIEGKYDIEEDEKDVEGTDSYSIGTSTDYYLEDEAQWLSLEEARRFCGFVACVMPDAEVVIEGHGQCAQSELEDSVQYALGFAEGEGIQRRPAMDFPDKEFSIIYADPPWQYKDKCHAGRRGVGYKYPVMRDEDIALLPVDRIAAPDSALFLWVTGPRLPFGLQVMSEWGFEYKTVAFTWVKRNPKAGTLFWGMGNWTRANPEWCLLGVRGKPKRQSAGVHSVLESPIGRHSEKPAEVRDRIVALLGDKPRIELFARDRVAGWDAWGEEV